VETTIHVLENLQQPVLCSTTQRQQGILHDSYPQARINQLSSPTPPYPSDAQKEANLTSLMAEFQKKNLRRLQSHGWPTLAFFLRDDAIPVKISGSRPISEPLKILFREELNAQIEQFHHPKGPTQCCNTIDPQSLSCSKEKGRRSLLP
jgi:hypothetical protein